MTTNTPATPAPAPTIEDPRDLPVRLILDPATHPDVAYQLGKALHFIATTRRPVRADWSAEGSGF